MLLIGSIISGAQQWCKYFVQKPPFFAPDMVQIVVQNLGFRTILGGLRVRGQNPLSFDTPKPLTVCPSF